MIKVSIITVSYNCLDQLKNTLKSINDQTYGNIEIIVIDGGSEDGTLSFLKSIENNSSNWISEPDHGIYNAMNKGISRSSGDYILFMNSGDCFAGPYALKSLTKNLEDDSFRPVLISGRQRFVYKGKLLSFFKPSVSGFVERSGLPHQATLIRADIQKKYLYDERFKIAADREFWERLKKEGLFDAVFIDDVIANVTFGGKSTTFRKSMKDYLEGAFIDYVYYDNFGLKQWFLLFFKPILRKTVFYLLLDKIYLQILFFIRYTKQKYSTNRTNKL